LRIPSLDSGKGILSERRELAQLILHHASAPV
jgi:hypothetical protein